MLNNILSLLKQFREKGISIWLILSILCFAAGIIIIILQINGILPYWKHHI